MKATLKILLLLLSLEAFACRLGEPPADQAQNQAPDSIQSIGYTDYLAQQNIGGGFKYLTGYAFLKDANGQNTTSLVHVALALYDTKNFVLCYEEQATSTHILRKGSWGKEDGNVFIGKYGHTTTNGKETLKMTFVRDIVSPGLNNTDIDLDLNEQSKSIEDSCREPTLSFSVNQPKK